MPSLRWSLLTAGRPRGTVTRMESRGADGLLSDDQVRDFLAAHPDWTLDEDGATLRRSVTAPGFATAVAAVAAVAVHAERADHHPDIDIRWRTVHFALSTHSAGGLTGKDLDLAATIDELLMAGFVAAAD